MQTKTTVKVFGCNQWKQKNKYNPIQNYTIFNYLATVSIVNYETITIFPGKQKWKLKC